MAEVYTWKKGEPFSEYCHDKVMAGYKVPVDNKEMVDFLIDGIPSASLKNQARMQRFSMVHELCEAFRLIKLEDAEATTGRREYAGTKGARPKQITTKTTSSGKNGTNKPRAVIGDDVRCYEYNQAGHFLRECPQKKANTTTPAEEGEAQNILLCRVLRRGSGSTRNFGNQ